MSYFDSLSVFKTTADGEIIYFPNSFFGKGFIVPSLEKKQEIQKSVKHFYKVYFFLIGIFGVSFAVGMGLSIMVSELWRWILVFLFTITLLGIGVWAQRSKSRLTQELVEGLVESTVKVSIFESHFNSARSINFIFLMFLGVASWYFAFSGFQIAKAPVVYPELFRPIGIGVLAFGGLGCITVCYMALLKIRLYFSK